MQIVHSFVDHKNPWPSLESWSAHYFVFYCCRTDGLSSFQGYFRPWHSPAIWSFIQTTDRVSQNHRLFPLTDYWGSWFLPKILKMKGENTHNQQKGLECLSSFSEIAVIHNPVKSPQANHFSHSLIPALPLFWVASLKEQLSSFVPLLQAEDQITGCSFSWAVPGLFPSLQALHQLHWSLFWDAVTRSMPWWSDVLFIGHSRTLPSCCSGPQPELGLTLSQVSHL